LIGEPCLDRSGGNEKDFIPLEVLDRIGVAGVVEESQAGVDGAADGFHTEALQSVSLKGYQTPKRTK
jgi:hypothetical protein